MSNQKKTVLVVGAGASGLPSIRHALLYEDVDVVCFEATNEVGGLWWFKPEETNLSSVMKSTVINTSKEMTAYSDYPPNPKLANFMHNREMWKYLKDYADHFDLRKYIRFGHKVTSIKRASDYEQTGKWTVSYTDDKEVAQEAIFDGVLLCSGHHATPHMPQKFPGQDQFKGRIIHSHSYKDHRGYEDKVVVVVGIGNSGIDVAVELSRIARQVYMCTRRGTWVFNRVFDYGEPVDLAINRKYIWDLRDALPSWVMDWYVERKLNARFDHHKFGLRPKHRVFSAHPTINDELPNRIACGTVRIKPNIGSFTENGLVFEDGTSVEDVHTVVMSTGYDFEFDIIEEGKLIAVKDNEVKLYKYMFPLETVDHNSLAIIGLTQPFGSIMPISEMQARVFFENLAGKSKLPPVVEMKADIKRKRDEMRKRFVESRRHTIQVDYVTYMEELAQLIGCDVDTKQLFLSDPILAFKTYFGPRAPYVFRLRGPNAWKGARKAIMEMSDRVEAGMSDNPQPTADFTPFYYLAAVILFVIYRLFF